MSDLVVDSQIRGWVFLPIVVITFLVGILRHYISILLATQKKIEPQQLQDSQVILRSRVLRENGRFIPRISFLMRRQFFNNEENGYLTQKRPPVTQNVMTDPSMMTDMLKGNVTNVLPMIIIGGWINWMFSGFITTRVPFPLTLRFKPMLQRGIELMHLDASWVSSASWYFLNVFGLRSIYALVLGENNARVPFPLTIRYRSMLHMDMELRNLNPSWVSSASWYILNEFGLKRLYLLVLGQDVVDAARLVLENALTTKKLKPRQRAILLYSHWLALQLVNYEWELDKIEKSVYEFMN